MNLLEENVKQLRDIVNNLYSCIDNVGAYSKIATVIEKACFDLNCAIDE